LAGIAHASSFDKLRMRPFRRVLTPELVEG
jgi:hypothetical protein